MSPKNEDVTRRAIEIGLAYLLLLVLLYALFNTISVFTGVFTFAIIFSVSFFGPFEKLSKALKGRRKLAAFLYALLMLAIVALPFIYGAAILGDAIHATQKFIGNLRHGEVPPLPSFVTDIPYLGPKVSSFWQQLEANPEAMVKNYQPQIMRFLQHLLSAGAGVAGAGLEIVIGIIISAVFLYRGSALVSPLQMMLGRLAGEERAVAIVESAGRAIKGVAVGVMGTGLIAGFAAWLGYSIAGLGIAPVLAVLTFLLVVIQLGPVLILIPAVAWLAAQGETGSAVFLGIYGVVVLMSIDNVLKPILIGKSGKLPILVLFLGVVGGMAAWGFTGMFKGAIIMAIAYTLFQSWFATRTKNNTEALEESVG